MFSLSIIIIIYNLHHIFLPTLPSCLPNPLLFEKVCIHGDTKKIVVILREISLPLMHRILKNILSSKHGVSFSTNPKSSLLLEQK